MSVPSGPVFCIGSLSSNADMYKRRLVFGNSGSQPSMDEAIEAVRAHYRMNYGKMPCDLPEPDFEVYRNEKDGSVLVEVSDRRGLFGCTIALYKIVPMQWDTATHEAGRKGSV